MHLKSAGRLEFKTLVVAELMGVELFP
jgi:hypothetical protein